VDQAPDDGDAGPELEEPAEDIADTVFIPAFYKPRIEEPPLLPRGCGEAVWISIFVVLGIWAFGMLYMIFRIYHG
jgi:hypothetical protein